MSQGPAELLGQVDFQQILRGLSKAVLEQLLSFACAQQTGYQPQGFSDH